MGNALSMAATSRLLRAVIEGNVQRYELEAYVGEDVLVTSAPPRDDDERVRINVFLYRVVENPHMHNEPLPIHDAEGRPVQPPVLALNFHYAVTAYAQDDYQSELMIGCAAQALEEVPMLNRGLIREILSADESENSIMDSRLYEQFESIRIRHRNLDEEAFTRLWSAFHVPYRLSMFYEVSTVLIESEWPVRVPGPVLARPLPGAHGSMDAVTPALTHAVEDCAAPGEEVTLHGVMLEGANLRIEADIPDASVSVPAVDIPEADATETAMAFTVPATWPVGLCDLRVSLDPPGGGSRRVSNRIPFAVRPVITNTEAVRDPDPPALVTLTLTVSPEIQPGQRVDLMIGGRRFSGPTVDEAATDTLVFDALDLPAENLVIRVQVDGIETRWLDRSSLPATILPEALVEIP